MGNVCRVATNMIEIGYGALNRVTQYRNDMQRRMDIIKQTVAKVTAITPVSLTLFWGKRQ